jgi:thioredoxin 1
MTVARPLPRDNSSMDASTTQAEPTRAEVDALAGATVLEFGTSWCGWCRGAQPLIREALAQQPQVRHIKVEDGPGQPLGRSYRVKLWPTLVFLKDGKEVARVTRPGNGQPLQEALARIV